MGSGKLLKRAIKKYGIENFDKEIVCLSSSEEEMNIKEKELVVLSEQSYNLCPGGEGGFGYINEKGLNVRFDSFKNLIRKPHSLETKKKFSEQRKGEKNPMYGKKRNFNAELNPMFGKHHSEETKYKMKFSHQGLKNSQYGTCWITNGQENKKIKKEELDLWINKGYNQGRKLDT